MKVVKMKAYPTPCDSHKSAHINVPGSRVAIDSERAVGLHSMEIAVVICPECRCATINGSVTFYDEDDTR